MKLKTISGFRVHAYSMPRNDAIDDLSFRDGLKGQTRNLDIKLKLLYSSFE